MAQTTVKLPRVFKRDLDKLQALNALEEEKARIHARFYAGDITSEEHERQIDEIELRMHDLAESAGKLLALEGKLETSLRKSYNSHQHPENSDDDPVEDYQYHVDDL